MASQSIKRTKIKCSDCTATAKAPEMGHFKCIRHRSCSGSNEWQPENCDACMLLAANLPNMPKEERDLNYDKIYKILENSSTILSSEAHTWVFEEIFSSFFEVDFVPKESAPEESSNAEVEEGEIPETEAQQSEKSSEGDSGGNQQDSQMNESVGTNALLLKVVSGLQDLTSSIKPLLTQRNLQDTNRSRSRKRRRSPSPHNSERSDESEVDEDRSSPDISQPPFKRRRGEDYFNEGSTIYFYTDDRRRVSTNKVWFNGELRDVKWHPTTDAFSLVTVSDIDTPFMTSTQAHESLVTYFNTLQDPSEKPGLDRKSYQVHFNDNKGLAHAMRLIQEQSSTALHRLYSDSHKYWETFSNPAFKASTMVNFSSGWTFAGDRKYLDWASNKNLDPSEFGEKIMLPYPIHVPPIYLKKENKERTLVVDSLSGLSMLESLAYNLRSDIPAHTAVEAISRHYCSLYGDTTLSWYKAKNDVRKIVLQGTQSPFANVLLQSSMWEPTVFSKEAVEKLIASDEPKMGIERRLHLSQGTYKHYLQNPKSVDPDKLGKKKDDLREWLFRERNNRKGNPRPPPSQTQHNKQSQNNQYRWAERAPKGQGQQQNKRGPPNKKKRGKSGFGGPKGKNNNPQQ